MSSAAVSDAQHRARVKQAITYAEKTAGENNAAFVKTLQVKFLEHDRSPRGRLRLAVVRSGLRNDRSAHIYEDPRFLKNARELARRTQINVRVIGGSMVKGKQFLDCVAVGNDAQWGCTGTLIAPHVVITAGHCAQVATRVFVGNDVGKKGKVVNVVQRIRHPDYNRNGNRNDLLVLILEHDVTGVPPRRLAASPLIDAATDGRVVGFGATEASGFFGYGVKRQVDVPIASPSCQGEVHGEEDEVAYGCHPKLELIAGKPLLARDSCNGDSGGPFYIADSHNQWFLAGATSRATDSAVHNCGDGGVYVRVDRYREWIESAAGGPLP